jgi:hypothetical protein
MAEVRERQQSWWQQAGVANDVSGALWLCGVVLRQHFRVQQAPGVDPAAQTTGANTLVSARSNSNLAVSRRMDAFPETGFRIGQEPSLRQA